MVIQANSPYQQLSDAGYFFPRQPSFNPNRTRQNVETRKWDDFFRVPAFLRVGGVQGIVMFTVPGLYCSTTGPRLVGGRFRTASSSVLGHHYVPMHLPWSHGYEAGILCVGTQNNPPKSATSSTAKGISRTSSSEPGGCQHEPFFRQVGTDELRQEMSRVGPFGRSFQWQVASFLNDGCPPPSLQGQKPGSSLDPYPMFPRLGGAWRLDTSFACGI